MQISENLVLLCGILQGETSFSEKSFKFNTFAISFSCVNQKKRFWTPRNNIFVEFEEDYRNFRKPGYDQHMHRVMKY